MTERLNMENIKNIYMDELVRENARLSVQHEADRQLLEAQEARLAEQTAEGTSEALAACERAQQRARIAEAKLDKAIKDLLFVMAGGDPCKVCSRKCLMGEGNCSPVWKGAGA